MNPTHGQANDPIVKSTKAQGISNPIDLNLPIAVRKGVRNCTLPTPFIPRYIEEILRVSEWKAAVLEEMDALKKQKMGLGEITTGQVCSGM